ncbi:hypothetical protein DVR12_01520 [Chitinophaga silvatica]|uniref:MepB protein n=1 Tax=Chitinophaga silvatica TaxID=2282649 RepID=A0A3E1YGF1_9BACT|nr:MepB family protein [Chitinophaga silvatica]RFS26495.1 hypothetical protein DVR12_01520 [Chitinophaga silvatica]
MNEVLSRIDNSIFQVNNLKISNLIEDLECEEYFGFNFQLENLQIKFRKAKITPKKVGQFVTLWKRNASKITEPFNVNDDFDFYIIAAALQNQFGFFLFPKQILSEKQILTTNDKEGKRGFRVYTDWDIPENKQAEKTKEWQTNYFIDLSNPAAINFQKFKSIISRI